MLEWFLPRADLDCVLIAGRYSLLDTRAGGRCCRSASAAAWPCSPAGVFNSGVLVDPGPGATYDYQPAAARHGATGRGGSARCAPARAAARRRRAAVHAAPPGGHRGRRRRAQPGGDRRRTPATWPPTSRTRCSTSWPPTASSRPPSGAAGDRRRAPPRLGSGAPAARLAGGLPALNRAFGLDDFERGRAPDGVTASVLVQVLANTDRDRGVPGARRRARRRSPAWSAGPTWPPGRRRRDRPAAGLPGGDRLAGIRHLVQDEPDPDWLRRPEVRRGLRAVGAAGLVYDLLIRPPQLPAALA